MLPKYVLNLPNKRSLCYGFIELSAETWDFLGIASKVQINVSEETITDNNLIRLQSRHPKRVRTHKFPPQGEALQGADWEFWLMSRGTWLGFRMQAKKLDSKKLDYPELDHVVKSSGKRQIDLLIDNAVKNADRKKRIPLYIFYNYWKRNQFSPFWLCGSYKRTLPLIGCSMVYAEHVRHFLNLGSKKLVDLSGVMYPWSCLVCCHGYSNENLPKRAFKFVKGVFDEMHRNVTPSEYLQGDDFLTSEPPSYIAKVAEDGVLTNQEWGELNLNRIVVITE